MRKIIERAVTVAIAAGIVLAAYSLGAASTGAANTETLTPASTEVHVSLTYDEVGEAQGVELTDAEGQYVPVGSVAEDREAMFPAEYANTDTEEN